MSGEINKIEEKIKQEVESHWENTPKPVKNFVYLMAVIIGIIIFLFVKGYFQSNHDADYFFDKWNKKDSVKMKVIENKLGQLSYISEVTKLNNDQINKYADSDAKLKELTKKYSNLLALVSQKMGVYVDTIKVNYHDTLPCADFVKKDSVKNRYYNFDYMLTKSEFMITNLEFPDTVHTIIGERRYGFLGLRHEFVLEQTHSNKYVKIEKMTPVVKVKKNRWAEWFGGGVGVGSVGSRLLFR
jgi:hypothetical protein